MKQNDFITAIETITNTDNLSLCNDKEERNGIRNCICVYRNETEFIGKIRFCNNGNMLFKPSIDLDLLAILNGDYGFGG